MWQATHRSKLAVVVLGGSSACRSYVVGTARGSLRSSICWRRATGVIGATMPAPKS